MFDLLANTMSAFNQVTAFLAALACGGLGAFLVGTALYWRLHALRVQGVVVGVRQSGNCFNAVYRYTSPTGESVEATSVEGSSSTRGKQTGTQVPLLVIPGKPQEVQEARHHLFTVIGLVLLASGVGIFCYAAKSWRIGPMTWVVGLLFLVHLLNGLRKILTPQDKSLRRLSLRGWIARKEAAAMPASPVLRLEDLAAAPQERERQSAQRQRLRRFAPLLLLAGIGLLALGVQQNRTLARLESAGMRAPGVIVRFETSHGSGAVTYYPRVTYSDGAGRSIGFRDNTGSSPPRYRRGDVVTVLYLPQQDGSAIIDRGVWNWLPALLLYLCGAVLSALGVAGLRSPGTEPAVQVSA